MTVFDASQQAEIDAVVEHLNAHHADTVLFVARSLAPECAAAEAEIAAIDPLGATLILQTTGGEPSNLRLLFPTEIRDASDAQAHLLDAVATARKDAGADVPLTSIEAELQTTASLRTVHATVSTIRQLTPTMLEVTLDGLDGYPLHGGDEFVYVVVSNAPGGIDPTWDMSRYERDVDDGAIHGAYYTIRRARPDCGEIDLWVAQHDGVGTVADWMTSAQPGDRLALWGPRHGFDIPSDSERLLLVADESGLAAVAALLEAARPDMAIVAVLEARDLDHRPPMPMHPRLRTVWVDRHDAQPGVGDRLLAAVRENTSLPPDAAFGAAESRQISTIRRHLRHELHLPATRVSMTGYWRRQS